MVEIEGLKTTILFMKKMRYVLLLLFTIFICAGCGHNQTSTDNNINSDGQQNSISMYYRSGLTYVPNYTIYIDNETGVLYLNTRTGITPMYNTDGTLKTAEIADPSTASDVEEKTNDGLKTTIFIIVAAVCFVVLGICMMPYIKR